MFKKHKSSHHRRGSNPIFVLFRMMLSLGILLILVGGVYSAYRQFSGADPLKMSPQAIIANFTSTDSMMDLLINLLKFDPKSVATKGVPEVVNEFATDSEEVVPADESQPQKKAPSSALNFKFALVSDSHNENNYLKKALDQAKSQNAQFVIGLGDYTEVGTLKELEDAKKEFDSTGLRYFVTPGDHDLWDSRDKGNDSKTNFVQTFGRSYQAFSHGQVKFIILDNSDNYRGVEADQMSFLTSEISKAKADSEIRSILVFLHEPLYHPSSDRVMGKVKPELKTQSKDIIKVLSDAGVAGVFSGDIHYFTTYSEPETNLKMTTLGALASLRNTQNPRFGMVSVYEDGSWTIDDVEVH